jgi:5'-3' exonuclease
MKALIDGDILRYEIGCATDDEGHPLIWPLVKARVDGKLRSIAEKSGAGSYVVYMSGKDNFRVEAATIRPYKGNRSSDKPYWHDKVEEYLKSGLNHPVVICDGYEADDGMSIAQCAGFDEIWEDGIFYGVEPNGKTYAREELKTIICSRDKDLHMVPGWHYSWGSGKQPEREPWFTTEDEGMKLFFLQLLTGDVTDNIPGLYMIGPVKAEKLLEGITEPLSMYAKVREQYVLRFGHYWDMFMNENAALLWMLREEPKELPEYESEELLIKFNEQVVAMEEMAEVPDV